MKNRLINAMLVLIAYLLTCAAVFTGQYFQSAMIVRVGDVSLQRIVATRDIENVIATAENRAEAAAVAETVNPIAATLLDVTLNENTFNNLYLFFDRLEIIRTEHTQWLLEQEEAYQQAYTIWQQEVEQWAQWELRLAQPEQPENEVEEEQVAPIRPSEEFVFEHGIFPMEEQFSRLPVLLSLSQQEFLLNLSETELGGFYDALLATAEFILDHPGIMEVDSQVLLAVQQKLGELIIDVLDVGYTILADCLVPNRMFDEDIFLSLRQGIAEDYEVVMVLENQVIVGEGEIITEEAYAIMESLGMLETEWTRDIVPLVGIFIIVAVTMLICCWFIFFYRRRIISHIKEALLLFTLYSGIMFVLWALDGVGFYFMPILIFTMLIAMLIDSRTAAILNLGFTVIAYFVVDGTMHYMLFFILAGSIICLLARYTTERSKIMMVSILAAFFNFILTVAISFAFDPHRVDYSFDSIAIVGAFAALNGVLTVIIAVGSLPLWEAVFGMVTPIKLLDLTNPTNSLMRRLTIEAPGTYHHSLIVANLAESAAYDIGANPHLARAGGYYHDIGKLKYPQYFAENITGINPHDEMDPIASAQIIVSHINYGKTLAAEYRLPQFLRDIIHEHHGTGLIKYFYCKAKEKVALSGSEYEVNEEDYRYPFNIPQSRESAVVMLADGVEAAVRSMMAQGKDVNDMKELINKMIMEKLTDGSLADSKLSIRDVDTIAKSFYRVLKGMYHERIPYPQEPGPGGEPVVLRR